MKVFHSFWPLCFRTVAVSVHPAVALPWTAFTLYVLESHREGITYRKLSHEQQLWLAGPEIYLFAHSPLSLSHWPFKSIEAAVGKAGIVACPHCVKCLCHYCGKEKMVWAKAALCNLLLSWVRGWFNLWKIWTHGDQHKVFHSREA